MAYRKLLYFLIIICLISMACISTSDLNFGATETPTLANTIALAPLATATPIPTLTPTPGPIKIIHTDFSAHNTIWDNQVGKDEVVEYQNPGYQIKVSKFNGKAIRLLGVNLKDIILSYQFNSTLSNTQTGTGSFSGIYCRYKDNKNYYALGDFKFAGNADSSYGIARVVNGTLNMVVQVVYSNVDIETITKVGQPEKKTVNGQEQDLTTYEARCIGDRLSLYRNNMLLLTAQDSALPSGDAGIGLWAGNMETGRPFTWVLSGLDAKDLTGMTQDGMEWKLARGEEYVIYNEDFTNPQESLLCDDPNTIKDDFKGIVRICENGGMKVYLHKTKASIPSKEFLAAGYYPIAPNMVIDFDATLINGNNQMGLYVGGGNPNNVPTFYVILLQNGTFDIQKCANNSQCKEFYGNKRLGVNPVIKPLADGNHFTIKVIKGDLYFYINNILQYHFINGKIPYTFLGFITSIDSVVVYKNLAVKIPSRFEMDQAQ